ncbi:MAG: tripartite tricarboxylate transporter substrate binding protein [Spirochaetia bacterium]|jgi:tripartite-type tricarboxylate transporter receptor subunit TctC|nr:tripartite tricarboxylate transporter substrate binding protein [Spirochaetia bacterium]
MKNFMRITVAAVLLIASVSFVFAAGGSEAAPQAAEMSAKFPEKPISFLIPFGAGGDADLLGRALVSSMDNIIGEPVVPVNRPGAGGGIMYGELHKAEPDGYTTAWNSTSILTTTIMGNVPFPYTDFDNICVVGYTSMPIAVLADSPWKTADDLVDWAKKNPGKLKIGNAGTGSGTHLTGVMFQQAAGVQAIHVPLGAERRIASLLGGEVEAVCVPLPEIAPQVKAGKARILGVSTAKRDPSFPDVPSLKEQGYDVVMDLFRGVSLPKGTDPAVSAMLEKAFKAASESKEFQDLANKTGFVVDFKGRADFEVVLADQYKRVYAAMDAAGLIKK